MSKYICYRSVKSRVSKLEKLDRHDCQKCQGQRREPGDRRARERTFDRDAGNRVILMIGRTELQDVVCDNPEHRAVRVQVIGQGAGTRHRAVGQDISPVVGFRVGAFVGTIRRRE